MKQIIIIFIRLYYTIKTFLYLQYNAKKIAIALDNCLRAFGQMKHTSTYKGTCSNCDKKLSIESPDKNCMLMRLDIRNELIKNGYWNALPNGWKWRKD